FGITTGSLPSITETQEFVVPKSIPIILLIILIFIKNSFFQLTVTVTQTVCQQLFDWRMSVFFFFLK
ncbi:MAG: hypothetical protein ACJA2L_000299, partial [Polaribacter sp.]